MNRRKYHQKYNLRSVGIVAACIILIVCFLGKTVAVEGFEKEEKKYKYYTSISIEEGDSLWSIADEYCDEEESVKEYVKELKTLNGLSSDTIHEGNNLMVYYYSTEYK